MRMARARPRDEQTDRQAARQTGSQAARQPDSQTDRERERETKSQRNTSSRFSEYNVLVGQHFFWSLGGFAWTSAGREVVKLCWYFLGQGRLSVYFS